ncbi:hypothetical protein CFOL_v3_28862, partial [Cephalotus follicularis]
VLDLSYLPQGSMIHFQKPEVHLIAYLLIAHLLSQAPPEEVQNNRKQTQ